MCLLDIEKKIKCANANFFFSRGMWSCNAIQISGGKSFKTCPEKEVKLNEYFCTLGWIEPPSSNTIMQYPCNWLETTAEQAILWRPTTTSAFACMVNNDFIKL